KACKAQVFKFPNAKYKKFYDINEAQNFIEEKNDIIKNNINDNDIQNLSEHVPDDQTNNRAEIFAIIRAIEICNDKVKLLNIMTDSKYVINAMEYWIKNWERNNYISYHNKPIKNSDLFKHLKSLIDYRIGTVKFIHVRGHMGNYGNEQADRLAKEGSLKECIINNNFITHRVKITDYFNKKK
ncbi:10093_t:CDS:2, partial [Gigaspora margarita]